MTRHLLAIGHRIGFSDDVIETVVKRTAGASKIAVERCATPIELINFVARHGRGDGQVDTLDVFDHGNPGKQALGANILFESTGRRCDDLRGRDWAALLDPHLSDVAQLRLLGCLTAASAGALGDRGRFLLLKLAEILGRRRIAFGAIRLVIGEHFGPDGFLPELAKAMLYSSVAALDYPCPTSKDRDDHLANISTALC